MPRTYSFTTISGQGILLTLTNECHLAPWYPDRDIPTREYTAIWDTGATASMVSDRVVQDCNLRPIGRARLYHASGSVWTEKYLVNIILPNNVLVKQVTVTRGSFVGGDILIGMDIISTGDFAVTNLNGRTKFTFRYPSSEDIDFCKDDMEKMKLQQLRRSKISRDDAKRRNRLKPKRRRR